MSSKIINYFINFLELQLFIVITSLPILILWGLPISIMSPVGNLIFTPILAIFLFVSSIVFFLEVIGIPNRMFITLLEKITNIWIKIINMGSFDWLISFKTQYLNFLLIPAVLVTVLVISSNYSQKSKVAYLLIILTTIFSILSLNPLGNVTKGGQIFNSKGKIEFYMKRGNLEIIDRGALSANSNSSWIDFKLLTELSKRFGTRNIQKLTLTRLNKNQIKSIKTLMDATSIKKIDVSKIQQNSLINDLIEVVKQNKIELIK